MATSPFLRALRAADRVAAGLPVTVAWFQSEFGVSLAQAKRDVRAVAEHLRGVRRVKVAGKPSILTVPRQRDHRVNVLA